MKSSVDYMNKTGRGDPPPDEGGEWECLPAQLCTDLTLLILEGRRPEWSGKGRTEGEHCPPARGPAMHQCQLDKQSCAQITSVNAYINFLCRNDIPVSVEVLLYPDCCQGNQNRIEVGASAEGGREQVPGLQEYVVLEQWIIQILPKRFLDGYSHFHVLMQAVRSFLHFSQLSAWLSNSQGKAPANIVYRVCAHGESFVEKLQPELHTFPILNISKSSSLQVSVASLARQQSIPMPACYDLLHNTKAIGKARTKTLESEVVTSHKHGQKHGMLCGFAHQEQNRSEHAFSMHERGLPYERHRHVRDAHREMEEGSSCPRSNQLRDILEKETRRNSLEHEWGLEAINQKKAQVRNKLRDSPKLLRNFLPNYRTDHTFNEGDSDRGSPVCLDKRRDSYENLFTPLSSLQCTEEVKAPERTPEVLCQYTTETDHMGYLKNIIDLEEGLSSLKLHHIPATPCTAFCTPEIGSRSSRCTSLGSTDSDQGITFTARPSSEDQSILWDDTEFLQSDSDQNEVNLCEALVDDSFSFDPFDYGDLFAAEQSRDAAIHGSSKCLTLAENCLDNSSHRCGSTNSLVNLSEEVLCHQPNADLCYIPSNGARVTAQECAARRRHVSGNSQDGLDASSKSASCETLTNQSAIMLSDGSDFQCFNAAVFKNKTLQDLSNGVKSSPSSSPIASPRRSSLPRGCSAPSGWNDDFTPDIPAPFCNGVSKPPVAAAPGLDEKENCETAFPFPPAGKGKSLLRNVLNKTCQVEEASTEIGKVIPKETISKASMRRSVDGSNTYVFNPRTGLPINSSPAPLRKAKTTSDCPSLLKPIGLTSSPSCNNLERSSSQPLGHHMRTLSTSAPATSCLLGNFEESVLNGRLEPLGTIDGFMAEIGASGAFCPKHVCLPVTTFFYSVCDDDAPSSYFGHINMELLGRRGYQIPKCGTIQVTLFNPNKTVVKMFVVRYDLSDMPPNCQTFARQRIFYMPSDVDLNDECDKELRYLVHLRFQTSKSGKVYLHTDIRMIFARHTPDLESSFGTFELRSFTEVPTNPRFSPKK